MARSQEQIDEAQQKFEHYVLALTFTVLALALSTNTPISPAWAGYSELAGRICLVVSGLIGLSRMEWVPVHFKVGLWLTKQSGVEEVREGKDMLALLDKKTYLKWLLQKSLFVVGVLALLVSRSAHLIH